MRIGDHGERIALLVAGLCLASACSHDITSPSPSLGGIEPDLVCNGESVSGPGGVTSVTLTGDNFTPMPSETLNDPRRLLLPTVTLDPAGALPGNPAPRVVVIEDDPTAPAQSRVHWASEEEMSFDVDPDDELPAGVFDVTVTNPDGSSADSRARTLAIIPPPIVGMVEPPAICDDQDDQTVVVTGANFLVFDGHTPSVTLGVPPDQHTYASTFDPADCEAVTGNFAEQGVQLCTRISFTVPAGDFDVTVSTDLALVVTNPPPADCASSSSPVVITLNPPPRVDSVLPSTVCEGGAQLTINGANFEDGAMVFLDCGSGNVVMASTVVVTPAGTQIAATFGGGAMGSSCQVIVRNPDGCEDRPLPHKTVNVVPGPIVFHVDPSIAYNGINTRITIYATTITPPLPADAVTIALPGGASTMLTYNTVVGHPNRLQAIVPMSQPIGTYDLTLKDGSGCIANLDMAVTVTDTTTVALKNVDPPFGEASKDNAVQIFRDTAAAAPNDHPFVETPRVFLNPTNPQPTDVAVEMESVAFLDADRVTGVVPGGTPVHDYDVVLVNPDGTVGVLDAGYRALAAAPPAITSATPASIIDATGQTVVLAGSNFATGNTVALSCVDAAGAPLPAPAVVAAAPSCTGTACTEQITINGSMLSVGAVCVVRLTNPDGTYGDFSAIGVTNSSRNLTPPSAGPDLIVGRRAPSAAAGNATAVNRFVYAIGGDSGMASGALASVEAAPVDKFGTIGAFFTQPPALRAPRTLAGSATIGRYIYLVGGNGGAGPVATAERALILSPRETPVVDDVDLALDDVGLDPGTYHYRVSAVFSATDPDNPGGESLASDEFTIRVPSFPNQKIRLTLVFRAPVDSLGAPLPNVASYRVYRTPTANAAPGTEVLLGTSPSTTFVDDGTATPGTALPLPLGSTGAWAALADLGTAREGVAVTWARDPVAPGTLYVYALLGRSSATTANASYEYLSVTTAANGRQTAGAAWTAGTLTSSQARWQLGAWTVDSTVSSIYTPPTTYVFAGGGLQANGMMGTRVEAGLVSAGGQLLNTSGVGPTNLDNTPKDFAVSQAGYGVCAANGQLFTFGGVNAMPLAQAKSALLVSPAPTLDLQSWNDEGLTMTHGRYLLGSAVQSAFIFLVGGQTDEPSAASRTTERVIW